MSQEPRFLDMFGCCQSYAQLCGGLDKAKIQSVIVSREERTMDVDAFFASEPASGDLSRLESCLAEEYGLTGVHIAAPLVCRRGAKEAPAKDKPAPGAALGKCHKQRPADGHADARDRHGHHQGEVVAVKPKDPEERRRRAELRPHGPTNTVRVSEFRAEDDQSVLELMPRATGSRSRRVPLHQL